LAFVEKWLANCKILAHVRVKTVQVAIHDPEYADSIRRLLLQDGIHCVQLVEHPDVTLSGVIVVDAADLSNSTWLANERERLIVIVHKEHDDLIKIWDAGVRHALFYGDSPNLARVLVLGVELSLNANATRVRTESGRLSHLPHWV
jgi:hypothetical protein